MTEIKEKGNARTWRRCPKCDSEDWERESAYFRFTRREAGETHTSTGQIEDMGHFKCLNSECKFEERLP